MNETTNETAVNETTNETVTPSVEVKAGRGQKTCPSCKKICGARCSVCPSCGVKFEIKAKTATPPTESVPEMIARLGALKTLSLRLGDNYDEVLQSVGELATRMGGIDKLREGIAMVNTLDLSPISVKAVA